MHSHSHGGKDDKADIWTNIGTFGEAVEGAANFFFGATVYNTLFEVINGAENQDTYGAPLYLGVALGAISLLSARAHRSVDIHHQHVHHADQHDKEHQCDHQPEPDLELAVDPMASLKEPLNPAVVDLSTETKKSQQPIHLTRMQKFTLFGDGVSHTFGRAGLVTGIVDGITTTFTKTTLPPQTRAWVELGATLFGVVTSISGIRTCKNVMLERNRQDQKSGLR